MQLFNASSLFTEKAKDEIIKASDNPQELRGILTKAKGTILKLYNFKAYNLPQDFTTNSYIIAANHLTDSDAPLIMSYYYQVMYKVIDTYPELFVFAKENCFNGVSIPKELTPLLEFEKVFEVDRNSKGGSMAAIRAAERWFCEGDKPKHFLIFSQGTIFDINQERAEDIERGTFWLSRQLGVDVLPTFIEQAVEGEENRLIFGEPISIPKECRNLDSYRELWLERVIGAQNSLIELTGKPARQVVLDDAHRTRKRFKPTE